MNHSQMGNSGLFIEEQLQENLDAAGSPLPAEEIERLNEISAPPQRYPYRFIEAYGQR